VAIIPQSELKRITVEEVGERPLAVQVIAVTVGEIT
jgi:hypothetical protein